jgi:hypothetical protein
VRTQIALRRSCSFQEHLRLSMESFAHIRIQYTAGNRSNTDVEQVKLVYSTTVSHVD